jgi:hypothetical protein
MNTTNARKNVVQKYNTAKLYFSCLDPIHINKPEERNAVLYRRIQE